MPLKQGYSKKTVDENIATMRREGKPEGQAVRVAYDLGRKCYFKRHPQGFLPPFLKLPNGRRDRAAYDRYLKG